MSAIRNFSDLQDEVGTENVAKALYKGTECGIVFIDDDAGVAVAGYAEGADAECGSIRLDYPFESEDFWTAVDEADAEGCALWDMWNDEG